LILSKRSRCQSSQNRRIISPPHFCYLAALPERIESIDDLGQHASFGGFEMSVWNKGMIVGLMSVLPLLQGCTRHSKSEHYYLITVNIDLPYWKTAGEGFQKAATEYGVTAEMRGPASFDPQAEVEEFRTVVARKPAGILVSVTNSSLLAPEIDKAIAAGIPVITMDSDAPESKRLYFVGTNNLQAGRLGGQRAAAVLTGKGNVVFFTMPGQPNLEERLKGYKDAFSGYPGITIVEVFDMKGDSGLAMDKTREYLTRKGKDRIDAFICLQSSAGKDVGEIIRRAKSNGDPGRLLITMDTDVATLQLIKDGIIDSTISQKPYTMALVGLKALDDIHHYPLKVLSEDYGLDPFSPFPAFVDTGVSLVDKSNVGAILTRKEAAGPQ
jgi:ribose transport system substrate-binding protein